MGPDLTGESRPPEGQHRHPGVGPPGAMRRYGARATASPALMTRGIFLAAACESASKVETPQT